MEMTLLEMFPYQSNCNGFWCPFRTSWTVQQNESAGIIFQKWNKQNHWGRMGLLSNVATALLAQELDELKYFVLSDKFSVIKHRNRSKSFEARSQIFHSRGLKQFTILMTIRMTKRHLVNCGWWTSFYGNIGTLVCVWYWFQRSERCKWAGVPIKPPLSPIGMPSSSDSCIICTIDKNNQAGILGSLPRIPGSNIAVKYIGGPFSYLCHQVDDEELTPQFPSHLLESGANVLYIYSSRRIK